MGMRERMQSMKDAGTAALALGVMAVDQFAGKAIDVMGDLNDAAKKKTSGIITAADQKIGETKQAVIGTAEAVKEKTVQKLGAIGDAIDQKATGLSNVASQFGKKARATLNFEKQVVTQAAEAAVEKAQAAAKKVTAKAKKRTPAKKNSRKPRR